MNPRPPDPESDALSAAPHWLGNEENHIRDKWRKAIENLAEGDVDLVIDPNQKRGHWKWDLSRLCFRDRIVPDSYRRAK